GASGAPISCSSGANPAFRTCDKAAHELCELCTILGQMRRSFASKRFKICHHAALCGSAAFEFNSITEL
ncbi:MAG: hypothetical protein ACRCVZ_01585, partial [Aestuariivirga sp.]